jgi:hypothetical protein
MREKRVLFADGTAVATNDSKETVCTHYEGVKLLEKQEIIDSYNDAKKMYHLHLEGHGVRSFPQLYGRDGRMTGRGIQIAFAYHYCGKAFDKEHLAQNVRMLVPGAKGDQQFRHYKARGYNIKTSGKSSDRFDRLTEDIYGELHAANSKVPSGMYLLVDLIHPHPNYIESKMLTRYRGDFSPSIFRNMCVDYKFCCSMCGKKSSSLEEGHLDPTKPVTAENIRPLCQICNNYIQDKWMCAVHRDGKVRIVAALSVDAIKMSPRTTKVDMMNYLAKSRRILV